MSNDLFAADDSAVEASLEAAIQALQTAQKGKNRNLKAFDELSDGMQELGITDYNEFKRWSTAAPHEIIDNFWRLTRIGQSNNSLRGATFEHLIELILVVRGVLPLYTQVTLAMVPNVRFDLVSFPAPRGEETDLAATGPAPICISLKTSLRERYKQAELEAAAVRGVYRWARCFLVTLDLEAARTVNAKIRNREVTFLEPVVVAGTSEFDVFVNMLASTKMTESPQIPIIHSNFATIGSSESLNDY